MKWAFLIRLVVLLSLPSDLCAQTDRANVFYPGIFSVYSDIVPGCDYSKHYNGQVGGTYFNPACFLNPPFGDFGDAPGYLAGLRKPNLATEDLGLSKTMQFAGDACQLRVYFQVFNVFNRHGFAGPNTQVGSAGFGQVLPQDLNGLPGPRVGQLGARFTFRGGCHPIRRPNF